MNRTNGHSRCRVLLAERRDDRPRPYKTSPDAGRPPRNRDLVRTAGYANLIAQLYFHADTFNAKDEFLEPRRSSDRAG
ncbi:hypothetical protein FTUN_1943 [Frigoriglobus tundricola]|uniref:Uncharacterized protein n=1 Tax=Frigoriglobus tundricola TaxID=2774151 RepID=A0A6M5YM91_9BACT|nr:hypothetical protein FTUN_1943 [Frigoriglobus tundricola]